MAVNVKLLRKVRKLIAEEPKRLRMRTWGYKTKKLNRRFPPCGTVACLAGWTVIAAHPEALKARNVFNFARKRDTFVDDLASELLGIPECECPFYSFGWKAPEVLNWIDEQIAKAK